MHDFYIKNYNIKNTEQNTRMCITGIDYYLKNPKRK